MTASQGGARRYHVIVRRENGQIEDPAGRWNLPEWLRMLTSEAILRSRAAARLPVAIHESPCRHCPSAHHPPDPESMDLAATRRRNQVLHAFRCGWRPDRLCAGYCEQMGMTEEELWEYNEARRKGKR